MFTLISKGHSNDTAQRLRLEGGIEHLCRKCHRSMHGNIPKRTMLVKDIGVLKYAGYDPVIVENYSNKMISRSQLKKSKKKNGATGI